MKRKHSLTSEKETFLQEYTQAIRACRTITADEIQNLVFDFIEDPERQVEDPRIQIIAKFIRKAIKENSVPVTWLTGKPLSKILNSLNQQRSVFGNNNEYEAAFQRLLSLNKISFTFEFRNKLQDHQIKMLLRILIISSLCAAKTENDAQEYSPSDITFVDVNIFKKNKCYFCEIDIKFKDGQRFSGEKNICNEFKIAKIFSMA